MPQERGLRRRALLGPSDRRHAQANPAEPLFDDAAHDVGPAATERAAALLVDLGKQRRLDEARAVFDRRERHRVAVLGAMLAPRDEPTADRDRFADVLLDAAARHAQTRGGTVVAPEHIDRMRAERVAKQLGVPDHVGLVWDEFVAFWLVLWLVPQSLPAQALAFVLFRFFDVVKPPPIRQVDARFKGGIGVMLDDLLAAGYTLLVMAIVVRFGVTL